jgi:hypothetical protein
LVKNEEALKFLELEPIGKSETIDGVWREWYSGFNGKLSIQKRDQIWTKKVWYKGEARLLQYLRRKRIVAWIRNDMNGGRTEAQAKESLRILCGSKQLSGISDICKDKLEEAKIDLKDVG